MASLDSEANNYYRAKLSGTAGGHRDNKYSGLATVSLEVLQAETRVCGVDLWTSVSQKRETSTYQAVGAVLAHSATNQSLQHPHGPAA